MNIKTRGIVFEPVGTLADMYNKRLLLYRKYANFTVSSKSGEGVESMVEGIIEKLSTITAISN